MIVRAFVALVAVTAISISIQAANNSPDEKAIFSTLDGVVGAQLDSDFPRLVSLLHPSAQRLFRNDLSACFDSLLHNYSIDQIRTVSGLPAHPSDLRLSDPQFFVFACEQEKVRHPDFVGDKNWLPFDIRDSVFHGDDRIDVTLSYARHVQTERTDYGFTLPFVIVLQREKSDWRMLSCPLSRVIASNWSRDLACQPKQITENATRR